MTAKRRAMLRRLRWYGATFCLLIVGNCCATASLGGPRVRRFSNGSEFANSGLAVLFLWTHDGRSSIAWDCLPGQLPEFRITRYSVFIVFPLWIPFLVVGAPTVVLFCRERGRGRCST